MWGDHYKLSSVTSLSLTSSALTVKAGHRCTIRRSAAPEKPGGLKALTLLERYDVSARTWSNADDGAGLMYVHSRSGRSTWGG